MTERSNVTIVYDRGLHIRAPFLNGGVSINNVREDMQGSSSRILSSLSPKQKDVIASSIKARTQNQLSPIGFEEVAIDLVLRQIDRLPKV